MQLAVYYYNWWILVDSVPHWNQGLYVWSLHDWNKWLGFRVWSVLRRHSVGVSLVRMDVPYSFAFIHACSSWYEAATGHQFTRVVVMSGRLKYQNCSIAPFRCGLVRLKYQWVCSENIRMKLKLALCPSSDWLHFLEWQMRSVGREIWERHLMNHQVRVWFILRPQGPQRNHPGPRLMELT